MKGLTNIFEMGIDIRKPLIHVQADINSTVSFSINNLIVKTLYAQDGILNQDNLTADYYYSPSILGSYTIVASTNDNGTLEKTLEISDIKKYDVYLRSPLYLYNAGVFTNLYSYGTTTSNGSVTSASTYLELKTNKSSNFVVGVHWAQVDITPFSTLTASRTRPSGTLDIWCSPFLGLDIDWLTSRTARVRNHVHVTSGNSLQTLDISSYFGKWYVGYGIDSDDTSWNVARNERLNYLKLSV